MADEHGTQDQPEGPNPSVAPLAIILAASILIGMFTAKAATQVGQDSLGEWGGWLVGVCVGMLAAMICALVLTRFRQR